MDNFGCMPFTPGGISIGIEYVAAPVGETFTAACADTEHNKIAAIKIEACFYLTWFDPEHA